MNSIKKTPKIKLVNVHKSFGNKKVLAGVDLEIFQGESLVIIGGSGTGKSVTLKCILGLLDPDKGHVEIDGKRMLRLSDCTVIAVKPHHLHQIIRELSLLVHGIILI